MMKYSQTVVLTFAAASLAAANVLPNSGFEDPKSKYVPSFRHFFPDGTKGQAGMSSEIVTGNAHSGQRAALIENTVGNGVSEVNYYKIPVRNGGRYFLAAELKVLSAGAKAKCSARIMCFDQAGKHLGNLFSPAMALESATEFQHFEYAAVLPAAAARVNITLWLGGEQKTVIDDIHFAEERPKFTGKDGNLLRNGSFETPALNELYIRQVARDAAGKNEVPLKPGEMEYKRDAKHVRTGDYALLLVNHRDQTTHEVNFNNLPYTPGMKCRFTMHYYVASKAPKARIAGRVAFWSADKKVLGYRFPEADSRPGAWREMNLEFHPPTGTARVTVTLWFSGEQKTWIDDLYYGEAVEKKLTNRHQNATLIADNGNFTLWQEASYLKVPPQGAPGGLAKKPITLSAARNEREIFQLIVTPKQPLKELSLRFGKFAAPDGSELPRDAFDTRTIGFIELKNPDNPAMKGLHADPLLPEKVLDGIPGRNSVFLISVDLPKGQKTGVYTGSIELLVQGKAAANIPVKVRVRDFELPTIPIFKSYFYSQPYKNYTKLDSRSWSAIADNMQQLLKEHRMSGNQAQWPPAPKFEIRDGRLIVTDWSKFDEKITRWRDQYNLRHFGVPFFGMMGDNDGWFTPDRQLGKSRLGFAWNRPEESKYICDYAKAFTEHVKKKFPDLDFYAYLYDEPPAKVHAELKKITEMLHKAAPDLKIFLVKNVSPEVGYAHTWVVPFGPGYIHRERQSRELAKGHEIWYYNWPVRLSDYEYMRNRLFSWQIYANEGSGGLLWNTVYAPAGVNPHFDMEKTPGCGSATIFYPPRKAGEGMLASLRSAQIRECIDDFDYLKILERRIDAHYPGQGRARVLEMIRELIPDLAFEHINDPHVLQSLRDRVGDEIERFAPKHKKPLLVLSTPEENAKTLYSELKLRIFGAPGAKVNAKNLTSCVIPSSGYAEMTLPLKKIGGNTIELTSSTGEKFTRTYTRTRDESLDKLQKFAATPSVAAFLKSIRPERYTPAEHAAAENLLTEVRRSQMLQRLQVKPNDDALVQALVADAKWLFEHKLFERAEHHLSLIDRCRAAGKKASDPVRITPVTLNDHLGFKLANNRVEATILLSGGRLISFKVDGVECLSAGSFACALPRVERARQNADESMKLKLKGLGGFEDAGAGDLYPESYRDWDFDFPVLTRDKVSVSASCRFAGTPFVLTRTMTLGKESPDLVIDYKLVNTMDPEMSSDDPEHFQFAWRGRFLPAIGADGCENDRLLLPTRHKLPKDRFDSKDPAFYELRSIKLDAPRIGAYDAQEKRGFAVLGSPDMSHAYVWFDSRTADKCYTLELPRSFYGKAFDDPAANRPFEVKPGKTKQFQIILRGLSGDRGEVPGKLFRQNL